MVSAGGGGNSAAFVYDALGRCVQRTLNGVSRLYTYDGWKPIVEWNSSGARAAVNIYGPGGKAQSPAS